MQRTSWAGAAEGECSTARAMSGSKEGKLAGRAPRANNHRSWGTGAVWDRAPHTRQHDAKRGETQRKELEGRETAQGTQPHRAINGNGSNTNLRRLHEAGGRQTEAHGLSFQQWKREASCTSLHT